MSYHRDTLYNTTTHIDDDQYDTGYMIHDHKIEDNSMKHDTCNHDIDNMTNRKIIFNSNDIDENHLGKVDYRLIEQLKREIIEMQDEVQSFIEENERLKKVLHTILRTRSSFVEWTELALLTFTSILKCIPSLSSHIDTSNIDLSQQIKDIISMTIYIDDMSHTNSEDYSKYFDILGDVAHSSERFEKDLYQAQARHSMLRNARYFLENIDSFLNLEKVKMEVENRKEREESLKCELQ